VPIQWESKGDQDPEQGSGEAWRLLVDTTDGHLRIFEDMNSATLLPSLICLTEERIWEGKKRKHGKFP
jgi:hypothetical protein